MSFDVHIWFSFLPIVRRPHVNSSNEDIRRPVCGFACTAIICYFIFYSKQGPLQRRHTAAMKKLPRYHNRSCEMGLRIKRTKSGLVIHSDDDCSSHHNDRNFHRRSPYDHNTKVLWSTSKQNLVTFSTTEVKRLTANKLSTDIIATRRILERTWSRPLRSENHSGGKRKRNHIGWLRCA